ARECGHALPRVLPGAAGPEHSGPGGGGGAGELQPGAAARLYARPPPDGGRPAVRRRRGDGDEARAVLGGGGVARAGGAGQARRAHPADVGAGQALWPRGRGSAFARGRGHPSLRALQGRGPPRGPAPGHRRGVAGRLHRFRRRDPGPGRDRRGGAAAAGRHLRPRVGVYRQPLRRLAQRAFVYAARGVSRAEGARDPALGRPCQNRRLAARAGRNPDARAASGPLGGPGSQL
ncbi:MAG: tRNA (guanine(37)-N(1))-methyltransferase, partial [uncultured Gemmatimonadetes bacterium]